MVYLDTSVIVALLANEPSAPRVSNWLRQQDAGSLFISGWTMTEFSSALSLKLRTRQIDADQRQTISAAFNRLAHNSFDILPITASHYLTAARFCDRSELNLRAGDALHVAVAQQAGLTLATLDETLSRACNTIGTPTHLL